MQQNQHPVSQTPTPTPPSLVEAYRCVLDWDVFVFLLIWYTPSAGSLWKSLRRKGCWTKLRKSLREFRHRTLPCQSAKVKKNILYQHLCHSDFKSSMARCSQPIPSVIWKPPCPSWASSRRNSIRVELRINMATNNTKGTCRKGVDLAEFLLIAF